MVRSIDLGRFAQIRVSHLLFIFDEHNLKSGTYNNDSSVEIIMKKLLDKTTRYKKLNLKQSSGGFVYNGW